MIHRFVAFVVLVGMLAAVLRPATAHAQEMRIRTISAPWLPSANPPEAPTRIMLTKSEALALAGPAMASRIFAPTTEIKLSPEAKTAIIIGAIVVGVLLIAGVIVLARPGKKLP